MDEIKEMADRLKAALLEQRAVRGRAKDDDDLDEEVRKICQRLLEAADVTHHNGCSLCGC